jgi:hypothetical protein
MSRLSKERIIEPIFDTYNDGFRPIIICYKNTRIETIKVKLNFPVKIYFPIRKPFLQLTIYLI